MKRHFELMLSVIGCVIWGWVVRTYTQADLNTAVMGYILGTIYVRSFLRD